MSLRVIGSVIGVTGIAGGAVATTFGTTGVFIAPPADNTLYTKPWNCLILSSVEDSTFSGLGAQKENYTAVNCRSADSQGHGASITDYWTGWFPKTLIKVNVLGGEISGTDFSVVTETKKTDNYSNDEYQTIFKGDQLLNSSFKGLWKIYEKNYPRQSITTVTISGESITEDKIYISFFVGDKQLLELG